MKYLQVLLYLLLSHCNQFLKTYSAYCNICALPREILKELIELQELFDLLSLDSSCTSGSAVLRSFLDSFGKVLVFLYSVKVVQAVQIVPCCSCCRAIEID